MDSLNIKVIIADRTYPLKVKPSEEEAIRNAAKAINDKIHDLQESYAASDKQDYLAMAALTYVIDNMKKIAPDEMPADLTGKLQELDQLVSGEIDPSS
jgi:cell division protein ZapA